jgi:D-alanyl-D-alanine carboxypeptidase (penicillin-binding protein 5/6)
VVAWLVLAALVAPGRSSAADPATDAGPPDLDAAAWILLDPRDGERLAAHDPARKRPIASTTKLMTAYLALDQLPLDKELTVPPYAAGPAESTAGLMEGEHLTVRDLLTAMLLPSANDAAETVAVGIGGTESDFVGEMNDAAADLGLERTSYANPIGLDDPDNYSTASDLATLALKLRENPTFRHIVRRPEATLKSGSMERVLETTNTLLLSDPSVDGVKTGHTLGAGYVLVASAKRKGIPLLSVVLGAPSEAERDADTERLLDYGYSLYESQTPIASGEELATASVRYEDEPLSLVADGRVEVRVRADQELQTSVDAPASVEGPIAAGAVLGHAKVMLQGAVVGRVPLVAAVTVAAPGIVDKVGGPFVVIGVLLVVFVIISAGVLVLRRRRGEAREQGRSTEDRMRSRQERMLKRQDGGTSE